MARVGEEFPLECPNCGGDVRLIAFITEPGPIRKILTHLSEPLEPPPVSPARGPPTDWGELAQAHDDRNVFQATDRRAACDRHPQLVTRVGRKAPKPQDWRTGRRSAPRRKNRHRRKWVAFRATGSGRPGRSPRGSRVARQPEDRCRSAIDRAILYPLRTTDRDADANGRDLQGRHRWNRPLYPTPGRRPHRLLRRMTPVSSIRA